MGDKRIRDFSDTYVMDEDVMDEMESFNATAVLDSAFEGLGDAQDAEDGFLDDIETSTVVLDNGPRAKKS